MIRKSKSQGKRAAATSDSALDNGNNAAVVFASDNGNAAVSRVVWLNEGKVSAAADDLAESASNFSTSNEVNVTDPSTATTLMMGNNEVLIFIADVD